jgi:hypothetical protein
MSVPHEQMLYFATADENAIEWQPGQTKRRTAPDWNRDGKSSQNASVDVGVPHDIGMRRILVGR